MRRETWAAGQLAVIETWGDDGYTRESPPGTVVEERPLTEPEQDALDASRSLSVDERTALLEERVATAEKPEHVDEWVAPTGAHDAPNIGDHRWHNGKVWRSTINGNTVEPGNHPGFDWWVETTTPVIPDKLKDPLKELRPSVGPDVQALIDVLIGE